VYESLDVLQIELAAKTNGFVDRLQGVVVPSIAFAYNVGLELHSSIVHIIANRPGHQRT